MRIYRMVLMLPVVLLAACSTFDQRWKETPSASPRQSWLQGKWEGTWKSDMGHGGGKLRAVVTPGNGRDAFAATFKATYAGMLNAEYTVDMTGNVDPDGKMKFHGTKDLGAMAGGVYTYDGWADAERFESTYTSKGDRGTFSLRRAR